MRDRIALIVLAALIVALVVLEVATPCAGYFIDQPECYIETRAEVEAMFGDLAEELGGEPGGQIGP